MMRGSGDADDDALGIETQYVDQTGRTRTVPAETLTALRQTLSASPPRGAAKRLTDPVTVVRADRARAVPVRSDGGSLDWEIVEEDGTMHSGIAPVRGAAARRHIVLPSVPLGYHRLSIGTGRRRETAELIVVPGRAYQPPCVRPLRTEGGRGAWGLAVQLYGLRSERNWGIGDFTDLAALVGRAASQGAAAVGVNPLHALFPDQPDRASPYSPSSRLFLNTLYLDITAIEDFGECPAVQSLAGSTGFQERVRALRESPLVDYAGVAACKQRAFELLYDSFRERHLADPEDARTQAFRAYQHRAGPGLRRFATFQALRETLSAADPAQRSWRRWPAELRDPAARAVAEFAAAHLARVEYHEYLQWQAELQLANAAARARAEGMGIGLYQDLAVGFDPDGADGWAMQDTLVPGWSIGAPPDGYNLNGQDWGLPPSHPGRLRALAYRPFIEMLRANMRHAGALRIDHVLGLKRLFWVPQGARPVAGAYIRYPFDDLLGLVALESVRHRCLVVGEDLGTVPKGFRQALNERGIFSYEVLYFARDRKGFRAPARWPKDALGTVATHDLPPLAGYWSGADIDLRAGLNLYPDAALVAHDRADRKTMRRELSAALRAAGLAAQGGEEAPVDAVHRFLARTTSRLVMAQVEDLVGQVEPANVPGTVTEHPNWRRKLARSIDAIFDDPAVVRRLAALREERPAAGRATPPAPRATYRLQLHKGFTFRDAEAILPYLQALGVSHVYLSPVLEAQAGSTHGYDTVSFDRLNPELGGEDGFASLAAALRRLELKALLDFVPNHMGIGGAQNQWWLDVLEWGLDSPYAHAFAIDWSPSIMPELEGRLLVPLLGDELDAVLARGELALKFEPAGGSFSLWYYGSRFPVRPADYPSIVDAGGTALTPELRAKLTDVVQGFASLPSGPRRIGNSRATDARTLAAMLKGRLAEVAASSPAAARALGDAAAAFGRQAGALAALLDRQFYRLASWRRAGDGINYRRFFDINQLAALRIEDPAVFDLCHKLVGRLIAEGRVHGLRLDHIDGLSDPAAYGRRLRRLVDRLVPERRRPRPPEPFPIVVEKILAEGESLHTDWEVDGTTGYDFTNLVNALFVDPAGARPLARIYAAFAGRRLDFDRLLLESKRQVIDTLFGGELKTLAAHLAHCAKLNARTEHYDADTLRPVLREIAAAFPVYRTYVSSRGVQPEDRRIIAGAVAAARRGRGGREAAAFAFVERALRGEIPGPRSGVLRFAMRFQQFTAPVMAKSLEDTAFYRYVRLLSLNEVGGDPRRFGIAVPEFHRRNAARRERWAHSLLATATHDTTRGEDARVRIDALSEIPDLWARHVTRWRRLTRNFRTKAGSAAAPSPNDEYLIYQTLVGTWPHVPAAADMPAFAERIKAYVLKATREAKLRTSWRHPDAGSERACAAFVDARLLSPDAEPFRRDFGSFQALVARLGALSSLSQTVLKLTLPGVPDIYQGCELWDLSLVDPDNRRPVDFGQRQAALRQLTAAARGGGPDFIHDLAASWPTGRLKLHVVAALLEARREAPALFAAGSYEPLAVAGPAAAHVVAFARRLGRQTMIVAAGRLFARLAPQADRLAPAVEAWAGTVVGAPRGAAGTSFRNVLTGAVTSPSKSGSRGTSRIPATDLFRALPAAVLVAER